MRMFAGIRWAKLEHRLQTLGNSDINFQEEVIYTTFGNQSFDSTFRGIGPRVGVDSRYCFGSGFGLDAQLSTALLVGNINSNYSADAYLQFQGLSPVNGSFESATVTQNHLVPNLDVKLGIDYACPIGGCNKSVMVFEAGYQTSSYFNAVNHTQSITPTGTGVVYQNRITDVTFDGLYVGVKYYA